MMIYLKMVVSSKQRVLFQQKKIVRVVINLSKTVKQHAGRLS